MFVRNLGCTLVFSVVCVTAHAQQGMETQTFEGEASAAAAGWLANDEASSPDRNIDLGWKDSSNTTGVAGEGGGTIHRSGMLPVGFYADTTIGDLTLNDSFEASGTLYLENTDFDGEMHIGFFDAQRLLADPSDYGGELAFIIAEPGGGVEPNFRWGHIFAANDQDFELDAQCDGAVEDNLCETENLSFIEGIPIEESVPFAIVYSDGEATFSIGEEDPVTFPVPDEILDAGASFTGFGLYTGAHITTSSDQSTNIFFDDLMYTSLVQIPGDYNGDGSLDAGDLDVQSQYMKDNNPLGDLNGDGTTDFGDRQAWIKTLQGSWVGDSNFDLEFNSGDLVQVFGAGKYETDDMASYTEGDWNGDMLFTSGDLVAAFTDGGYELGPPAVAAIPEPTSVALLLLGGLGCLARRHTRRRLR